MFFMFSVHLYHIHNNNYNILLYSYTLMSQLWLPVITVTTVATVRNAGDYASGPESLTSLLPAYKHVGDYEE